MSEDSAMRGEWRSFAKSVSVYIRAYGGFMALCTSPYLQIAIVLAAITFSSISNTSTIALQLLPNIVGFSIGAFALLFASCGPAVLKVLAVKDDDGDDEHSALEQIAATFVHFIVVQCLTILLCVVEPLPLMIQHSGDVGRAAINIYQFIELFLLFYSLLLILAAALGIYRFIRIAASIESKASGG